jgi:hypothetical protein
MGVVLWLAARPLVEMVALSDPYAGAKTEGARSQPYRVTRLNPRWGIETDLGTIPGGTQEIALPWGEWVVLCEREEP